MSKHRQLKVIQERNAEMLLKGTGLRRSSSPSRRRANANLVARRNQYSINLYFKKREALNDVSLDKEVKNV